MPSLIAFDFGTILAATQTLRADVEGYLSGIDDAKVAELAEEVSRMRVAGSTSDSPPLSIAFVGQYNAGKSTILRALTGRADIMIDADVCTDTVTAYDWDGVRLLDTPGIHAGYPSHDETTYAAIDRTDLLVFVITNELFDDIIGSHFRELAFERNRAREMLLVVNKMGQDAGSPNTKRADIDRVTKPLTARDFQTVFIDAKSVLEAEAVADDEDRRELLEIGNRTALVEALNQFVRERGWAGRLTSPLFFLRAVCEQAAALLVVDLPEERAALELLHRKRTLLLASRARLRSAMSGLVSRAMSDITAYGDEVAECVEPGKSEAEVMRLHEAAQKKAASRSERLAEDASKCVEAELDELGRQLEALRNGVLARELQGKLVPGGPGAPAALVTDVPTGPDWDARAAPRNLAEWPAKAEKLGGIARQIGDLAAKWATGPAAEGARIGSVTAARGSQAHQVVYNVGKFFGAKFQPWGAVKVARAIGNVGRVIAVAGGVLAVIAQVAEDRQQQHHHIQLRDARDSIRSAYRECALAVQSAFWAQFEGFVRDFFDTELSSIDDVVRDLVGNRSERERATRGLGEFTRRAKDLLAQTERVTP
jgi:hypothetical protein